MDREQLNKVLKSAEKHAYPNCPVCVLLTKKDGTQKTAVVKRVGVWDNAVYVEVFESELEQR